MCLFAFFPPYFLLPENFQLFCCNKIPNALKVEVICLEWKIRRAPGSLMTTKLPKQPWTSHLDLIRTIYLSICLSIYLSIYHLCIYLSFCLYLLLLFVLFAFGPHLTSGNSHDDKDSTEHGTLCLHQPFFGNFSR